MTAYGEDNITGSGIPANMTDAEAEAALDRELELLARDTVAEVR